jgi:hypothetical protein
MLLRLARLTAFAAPDARLVETGKKLPSGMTDRR